MKRFEHILFAAAMLLTACSQEETFSVPDCQKSYEFDAAGGTVFVSADASGRFDASCNEDWVFTQVYNGNDKHNVRITAYENTVAASRTAMVTLTSEDGFDPIQITVTQDAADPVIKVSPGSVSLTADDTEFTVSVSSNTNYTLSMPSWLSLASEMPSSTIGDLTYTFNVAEGIQPGEQRTGYVSFVSENLTSQVYVEQIAIEMETVQMMWGLLDIQYMWNAFGKVKTAITNATLASTDFSSYPKMKKAADGFTYTNDNGDLLSFILGSAGEFKINKAASKTSKGNIDRDGNNVERMQLNKATEGIGETCISFIAPRSGKLEIEAASPNSGEKHGQVMVDGTTLGEFSAPYDVVPGITTYDITVTSSEGAEVRIFGTGGAINYFRITYTYDRPKTN